jgi:hypothetical protein
MRRWTMIYLVLLSIFCFAQAGCDCGDDDDSEANDDAEDDDSDDDSAIDDDLNDDSDDDSDDDDVEVDQFLFVPAKVDDGAEKFALAMTQWIADEGSRAQISLIASPSGEVRRVGEIRELGEIGTAWISVEDFTGDGKAEIAISWITMSLAGDSESEVVLLDPQSLASSRILGAYEDAQAFLGPNADINGDGIPELIVRVRPTGDQGGALHAFDGTQDFVDLWSISAPPGKVIDLLGLPVRSAWIGPGDFSGSKGQEFLTAVYDRAGDAPDVSFNAVNMDGETVSGIGPFDLRRAGAFSAATADADRDGDPEIALALEQETQTVVYLIMDNFGTPERTFVYPAETFAQVSFRYDLDNDEQSDLVVMANPPDDDVSFIDIYLSSEGFVTATRFEATGDRVDLIGQTRPDGLIGAANFGSMEPVFGVSQENYGEGGPASIELYADPKQGPAATFDGLAGDGDNDHLRLSALFRDFDGDGLAELATISTHYLVLDDLYYHHRIAVFDDLGPSIVFDTDFIAGAAFRGSLWDFDEDNIPEMQVIHYGSGGDDAGWLRLINGKNDWAEAILEFTAPQGADPFLFGLIR